MIRERESRNNHRGEGIRILEEYLVIHRRPSNQIFNSIIDSRWFVSKRQVIINNNKNRQKTVYYLENGQPFVVLLFRWIFLIVGYQKLFKLSHGIFFFFYCMFV